MTSRAAQRGRGPKVALVESEQASEAVQQAVAVGEALKQGQELGSEA